MGWLAPQALPPIRDPGIRIPGPFGHVIRGSHACTLALFVFSQTGGGEHGREKRDIMRKGERACEEG
jgi:hypothetical protein